MSSGYSERINIKKTIVDNSSPQILTLYVDNIKMADLESIIKNGVILTLEPLYSSVVFHMDVSTLLKEV